MFFNNLFIWFPKIGNQLLLTNYIWTFSCYYITKKFQEKVFALACKWDYTNHLFKRKAAKLLRLAGLSKIKYNYQESGSQTAIVFMLKSILTRYIMHFKGINSLEIYMFISPKLLFPRQFCHQIHQILIIFSHVLNLKFNYHVNVCKYFIYKYQEFENEDRYVRRQGCNLKIQLLYLFLQPSCLPQLCNGMPGLSLLFNKEEIILKACLG